ncbi:hypothetical protein [Nonomuraea wenchangensis]|uniref:hypothetical protein n=1 Tax=Nonomuraea wenchangensis TaxID=568860 RepID=UPI00331B226B
MNDGVPLERLARRLEEVVDELRGLPVAVERLEDSAVVRDRIPVGWRTMASAAGTAA